MNSSEIQALIQLLDDTDKQIVRHVSDKLISLGKEATPYLEAVWETIIDPSHQKRIENIIHNIQYNCVYNDLQEWKDGSQEDLLEAFVIINRYEYPDIKKETIVESLEKIKHDIWLELSDDLTPLEKVKVINHILFHIHNFAPNNADFHATQNLFLNKVIETRKGSPLTLAIIYSWIAKNLDIPIYEINLPEHFILCYCNTADNISFIDSNEILFYINPFNKGSVFPRKEIEVFMKQINIEPKEYYFKPCSNIDIVKRLLLNLANSYKKLAMPLRENEINHLSELLD